MIAGQIRSKARYLYILIIVIFASIFSGFSQISTGLDFQPSIPDEIRYREKVFLHIDRKIYLSGEIIWFKGYCMDGELNILSDVSRVLYVEVLNNQNKPILSEKVLLEKGTSHGTVYIPRSIQTGVYYIRAYTGWMTNFSPEYYFTDKLYIVNPFLPVETFSINPDEPEEFWIRFYTHNGLLEKDMENEIVFHATNQAGRAVNLKGWVMNESGDTLSELNTWKYGYGLFSFKPVDINGQYRIITISSSGEWKEFPIPFPVTNEPSIKESKENIEETNNNELHILAEPDKSDYAPRERVTLKIRTGNNNKQAVRSNLSISVYKSDNQTAFNHKNIFQYLNFSSFFPDSLSLPDDQFLFSDYNSEILRKILGVIYSSTNSVYADLDVTHDQTYVLPETRGLTLNGTMYTSVDGKPSSGNKIYIAKPGKTAQIYATRSGYNGRFQMQLFDQYGRNDIVVMPAENPENYYVTLDEDFSNKYGTMNPEFFWPDDQTIDYIERLMISLQVADAFGNMNGQQKDLKQYNLPNIYGDPDESVLLEDYIKLPAVEELFTELVKSVLIKRKRNNNFELQIIDPATKLAISGKPLLLLDGVPVHDINPVIIYMDPIDIERIDVVASRYYQGNEYYQGIINIITKQADYHHFDLPSYATRSTYQNFQIPVTFNSPDHLKDTDSLRSIPDFRNLLYWNPEIITDEKGTATVSFFTADDISDYRIIIQGLSEDGLPGYTEGMISVK